MGSKKGPEVLEHAKSFSNTRVLDSLVGISTSDWELEGKPIALSGSH